MIWVDRTRRSIWGTPVGIALAIAVSAGVFLCAEKEVKNFRYPPLLQRYSKVLPKKFSRWSISKKLRPALYMGQIKKVEGRSIYRHFLFKPKKVEIPSI